MREAANFALKDAEPTQGRSEGDGKERVRESRRKGVGDGGKQRDRESPNPERAGQGIRLGGSGEHQPKERGRKMEKRNGHRESPNPRGGEEEGKKFEGAPTQGEKKGDAEQKH